MGKPHGRQNTKIHTLTAGDAHLKRFILSGGEEHDAPAGRLLLEAAGKQKITVLLLTDRAYADFKTQFMAWDLRFQAVAPPKSNTVDKREYGKELYKRRNEIERFFRRLKAFRAVFTRYDRLDIVFSGSVLFASIIILLCCVKRFGFYI
jgi:transposase